MIWRGALAGLVVAGCTGKAAPAPPTLEPLALGYRVDTTPLIVREPVLVVDADTVDIGRERIRISNLDAPEIGRADCPSERALGERATARLGEVIAAGAVVTLFPERRRDPYARVLARVEVDGRDVAETLISEGLARPWRGRSSDWC